MASDSGTKPHEYGPTSGAPLFFAAIAGPVGAIVYKAINERMTAVQQAVWLV